MRIRVHPNGIGDGKGTHLSVSMELLKGVYDNFFSWPFNGTIRFELLNRSAKNNHHYMMLSIDDAHNGCKKGLSKFIPNYKLSYDPVLNTQYLKDNTLYLRVSVKHRHRFNYVMFGALIYAVFLSILFNYSFVSPSSYFLVIINFLLVIGLSCLT